MSALQPVVSLAVWAAIPAVLVAVGTWPLIGWLRRRQLGKAIRDDGPAHQAKAGTPTMGGLVLVGVVLAAIVAPALLWWTAGTMWTARAEQQKGINMAFDGVDFRLAAAAAFAVVWFGAIGLLDDWHGLARKGRARPPGIGFTARRMFALQAVGAVATTWLATRPIACDICTTSAARWVLLGQRSFGPGDMVALVGWVPWLALGTLVVVAVVNGVNLSDGLDGLAAGVAAIAFAGLAVVLALTHRPAGDDVVMPASGPLLPIWAAGACLGLLVHNRYPARVFMGNVTSMALGGALAAIALASGLWPLLPILGVVYVAEVASDVIQVGYFKWSGGKRVFRMAPLHHHFELGGLHETAVTRRFWLAGALGAAAAVALAWWSTAGAG